MRLLPDEQAEQILAGAVQYLLDGQKQIAALMLLECEIVINDCGDDRLDQPIAEDESIYLGMHHFYDVTLLAPRVVLETLSDEDHEISKDIRSAFYFALPTYTYPVHIDNFNVRLRLPNVEPGWREKLSEAVRGQYVSNQGTRIEKSPHFTTWNGLKFGSASEKRIAEALDRVGVLFLPNCLARLGEPRKPVIREADFLVCYQGKWGLLEVDGDLYHPASRTTQDHARDRLFQKHGIRIAQHYDAEQCFQDPDGVVREFLSLLKQA